MTDLQKPPKRQKRPRRPIARSFPPKRTSKPAKVRQTAMAATRRGLKKLFREYIKLRDPICRYDGCGPSTDCAHGVPVSHSKTLEFDPDNAWGLSRACHDRLGNSPEWRAWCRSKLGTFRADALVFKANIPARLDYAAIRSELQAETRALVPGRHFE